MATVRAVKAISKADTVLRDGIWKDADEKLWKHKEAGGFVTVPKTMPYIARLMDETAKNTPLSPTYQALWSFTWSNDGFVKLGKIRDIAYAAGFNGERGIRTLRGRLKKLVALGFIRMQASGGQESGMIYIPNPHQVIIDHMATDTPVFRKETYTSFLQRAIEIGCKDVKELIAKADEAEAEEEEAEPETPPVRRRPLKKTGFKAVLDKPVSSIKKPVRRPKRRPASE
ncbi:hypothetical protein [Bosea robiniae]|uniref:Helix-turn-helix domain-containing protein n=1 Tax=Bosea robiniae TaxID=1036780 RepID=A0ABY0P462_9HYPH|nr:hypothetical protein [Bosea robiniae]SDH22140.1 hypothetical protein SAMN05421844_107199 [Bosea robiniae]